MSTQKVWRWIWRWKEIYATTDESVVSKGLSDINAGMRQGRGRHEYAFILKMPFKRVHRPLSFQQWIQISLLGCSSILPRIIQPKSCGLLLVWLKNNRRFASIPSAKSLECTRVWLCQASMQFHGKGKRAAWRALKSFLEVTDAFVFMAAEPFQTFDLDSFTLVDR